MPKFMGKKLLLLGGRPIGAREIVECAKAMGVYVIVTDYLPIEQSPAKMIADEVWDISTADIETLADKIIENHINGVLAGVNEFNIKKMIVLCEKTKLPCYCNSQQWHLLQNKAYFKRLCRKNGIPVTEEYDIHSIDEVRKTAIDYPVIIKPVDGSGSCGFAICNNENDLMAAFPKAVKFSDTGDVLIEKYMNYKESVIINYTIINGEIFYCGMSDKYSRKVSKDGSPIMAFQYYLSQEEELYLRDLDNKAKKMLSGLGFTCGVFWIEAFNSDKKFTFNEMGVRFGGSLTYLPIKHLYGFNQLDMLVEYALFGKNELKTPIKRNVFFDKTYCIFPIHVMSGTITKVEGLDKLKECEDVVKIVPVHYVGDNIDDWGSAKQVFSYIHFIADNRSEADRFAKWIMNNIHIYDEKGRDILFNLYV